MNLNECEYLYMKNGQVHFIHPGGCHGMTNSQGNYYHITTKFVTCKTLLVSISKTIPLQSSILCLSDQIGFLRHLLLWLM